MRTYARTKQLHTHKIIFLVHGSFAPPAVTACLSCLSLTLCRSVALACVKTHTHKLIFAFSISVPPPSFLLQGEGPMERIEARLLQLDQTKSGKMIISTFKHVLGTESNLQPAHIHYLVQAAGLYPPSHPPPPPSSAFVVLLSYPQSGLFDFPNTTSSQFPRLSVLLSPPPRWPTVFLPSSLHSMIWSQEIPLPGRVPCGVASSHCHKKPSSVRVVSLRSNCKAFPRNNCFLFGCFTRPMT